MGKFPNKFSLKNGKCATNFPFSQKVNTTAQKLRKKLPIIPCT